jgi:hypothetical protein
MGAGPGKTGRFRPKTRPPGFEPDHRVQLARLIREDPPLVNVAGRQTGLLWNAEFVANNSMFAVYYVRDGGLSFGNAFGGYPILPPDLIDFASRTDIEAIVAVLRNRTSS